MATGKCKQLGIPTSVFFPDEDHLTQIAYAKAICNICEIQTECLAAAQKRREPYGIWGGLTREERQQVRVREAVLHNSERRRKLREQVRPTYAYSSSPSHTSPEENHTPEVLSLDFARRLASRVSGIELSELLLLEESPSGPNQSYRHEHLWGEFSILRRLLRRLPEYMAQYPLDSYPESDQIEESESVSSAQKESDPILLFDLDLSPAV